MGEMHWIFSSDGVPELMGPAAVLIDEKIFMFGGVSEWGDVTDGPIMVFILDCSNFRWMELDHKEPWLNAPDNRVWHTAVVFEGKAYIWGGENDNNPDLVSNELHEFDPANNSWRTVETSGQVPVALMHHSACVLGDKMLVFGGEESDGHSNSKTFSFHFTTNTWTTIRAVGESPIVHSFNPAVVIGNRMFVVDGQLQMQIRYFDFDNGSWNKPQINSAIPQGRIGCAIWVHNGKMYVFGGRHHMEPYKEFNTILEFDPVEQPTTLPCCVIKNERLVLFGGLIHSYQESCLRDFSGQLHILDCEPSLKTLCIMNINQQGLSSQQLSLLPRKLQLDLLAMMKPNGISQ